MCVCGLAVISNTSRADSRFLQRSCKSVVTHLRAYAHDIQTYINTEINLQWRKAEGVGGIPTGTVSTQICLLWDGRKEDGNVVHEHTVLLCI